MRASAAVLPANWAAPTRLERRSATIGSHGDVHGRFPRLQGLARGRAGDPASGLPRTGTCEPGRRRRRRRQHVLRDARGRAEVPPGRAPGGRGAQARLRHRLRREPAATRSPACRRTSRSSRSRASGARLRGRRRRRGRLRPVRSSAPTVCERSSRSRTAAASRALLRHPPGPRRVPKPSRGGGPAPRSAAGSSRVIGRSCSRGSTSAATEIAQPATTSPASSARPARRRPRPPSPLVDRGEPSGRGARLGHARDAGRRAAPPRPAPVRRRPRPRGDGPPLHVATYLRRLERAEGFNLTTDVIVGFPAEDERGLRADTSRLVEQAGITKVHVFPYSPRPGTRTAPTTRSRAAVKRERSARLRAASAAACAAWWRRSSGPRTSFSSTGRDGATGTTTPRGSWTLRSASSCGPRAMADRRRDSRCPCLTASSAGSCAGERRRAQGGRVRGDPGHRPQGAGARPRPPRAPCRDVSRGRRLRRRRSEADARVRRRDGARGRASTTTG